MAIVRKTLDEIRALKPGIDRARFEAASEDDIARQVAEDPDTAPEITLDMLIAPKNLRRRLDMTQEQFAEALGIPVATLRNWEQRRNAIGLIPPAQRRPASRTLQLRTVHRSALLLKLYYSETVRLLTRQLNSARRAGGAAALLRLHSGC